MLSSIACLKGVISNSKVYLLSGKKQWSQSKTYPECKHREIKEQVGKSGKALGKHVINLYLKGISQVVKIRDVNKL